MNAEAILRKIAEIFNTGDTSEVDSIFSPNYQDNQRPDFITTNGSEEFKQIVELARKSLKNLQVTVKDLVVEEDKIAARLYWHGTNEKGQEVERETLDILHVQDGKVVEHWGAESWTSQK